MVDDDENAIFITRRLVRTSGIINDFISERKPEKVFATLASIGDNGDFYDKIIVLLDINMPRQDGFDTLRQIRSNYEYKNIPVIMLSASDSEADKAEAIDLGADGYLTKPFRGDAFFAAINGLPQVRHQLVLAT
jgi:DNA-binding response OmpR family regulator